jgi:hypothetical protein
VERDKPKKIRIGWTNFAAEICRGQVHVPKKERRKRRIRTTRIAIAIAKQ